MFLDKYVKKILHDVFVMVLKCCSVALLDILYHVINKKKLKNTEQII